MSQTPLDLTEVQTETNPPSEYSAGSIQVLKGLEGVRKRPAMYIGDTGINGLHELIKEIVNPPIKEANGYKIGIVGAGPSGLTAAYYLALRGFDCAIYEAHAKAGGMTMYGIPKYRFPEDSLDKQIEYIQKIGVKIHFNILFLSLNCGLLHSAYGMRLAV